MVAGKSKLSMSFPKSPAPPTPPHSTPKSSFTRSFASYFSRSSAQVQPRPSDLLDLLRIVEDLRERESLLKTQLLEHKLLKETVAIVPLLENEISSRDSQIESNAKKIEEMEAYNQRLSNELEELKLRMEEEKTENQRKTKALEDEIAELKITASDHVFKTLQNDKRSCKSLENDELSALRIQAPLEVPVKSNIIKSLKKTASDHGSVNQKLVEFEATVAANSKREVVDSEKPRHDSEELADSTESSLTRSRVPRVPKPPPRRSSSSSLSSSKNSSLSNSAASEDSNVETKKMISKMVPPPPPPPPKAASKAAPPPPPPPPKGSRQVASKVTKVPEVVEFYHSLMRRESQSRRESLSGVVELPPATNPRDMIGEIENRSSHLLAVKCTS